jgi:hypothetical protein
MNTKTPVIVVTFWDNSKNDQDNFEKQRLLYAHLLDQGFSINTMRMKLNGKEQPCFIVKNSKDFEATENRLLGLSNNGIFSIDANNHGIYIDLGGNEYPLGRLRSDRPNEAEGLVITDNSVNVVLGTFEKAPNGLFPELLNDLNRDGNGGKNVTRNH